MLGFCWSIKRFSALPLKLQISQTGSIANWGYWQSIISQWTTQSCANKGKAKVPLPCDRFRFGFFYQLKTSNWQKSTFIIRGDVQQSFKSVPFHVTLERKARTTTLCFTQWRKQHTLLAVTSLFVVGGDAPLDFEVGGRLAVELTAWPRFGQRQVAAGGRVAGLQLRDKGHIQNIQKPSVSTVLLQWMWFMSQDRPKI